MSDPTINTEQCPVPGDWQAFPGLPIPAETPILGLGAELKSTLCFAWKDRAWGYDCGHGLTEAETYRRFRSQVDAVLLHCADHPVTLVHDQHPQFLSTELAHQLHQRARRRIRLEGVQHHHAHAASCMAEHGVSGQVLAVTCDGTGYGEDGTTWGGELLFASPQESRRLGGVRPVPLPGGDLAAREIWRTALGMFSQVGPGESGLSWEESVFSSVDPASLHSARQMLQAGLNCPRSSGLGRVFDACAFVLGLANANDVEGEGPMRLEATAVSGMQGCVDDNGPDDARGILEETLSGWIRVDEEGVLLDTSRLIYSLARLRYENKLEPELLAARFHTELAEGFFRLVRHWQESGGEVGAVSQVVLTGGCFLNKILTKLLSSQLEKSGLDVLLHERTPPGDAAISYGQAYVAASRK